MSLDITDRKLAEDCLCESESKLAEAQRMAHLGYWELDLASNRRTWSEDVYRIFEIDPEAFSSIYEASQEAIHPGDRDAVNAAYTESLKNRSPYQSVHRLLMKDGRIKYLLEKCETVFDDSGKPLQSKGPVLDVTTLKQAERALREHQKVLEQTLEGTFTQSPEL